MEVIDNVDVKDTCMHSTDLSHDYNYIMCTTSMIHDDLKN